MKKLLFLLCLAAIPAIAQNPNGNVIFVIVDPSGACSTPTPLQYNIANNDLSGCSGTAGSQVWGTIGGAGGGGNPGGSTGQVQYKVNGTTFGGFTMSGDCTLVTSTGVITCPGVNGAAFPISATVVGSNGSGQPVAATLQGNGAKVQLSTGSTTTNDCVKFDASGNTVDNGSGCGGTPGGGQLVDATPGASPTYNFTTGVAGGTSTATTCSPLPCGSLNITLSANSTAPTFTFSSTSCVYSCTIQVNQGGTAYTGFTWPANVVGAPSVTLLINTYTLVSGYYDASSSVFRVVASSTNGNPLVVKSTQPASPPLNTGNCNNYLDTSYDVAGYLCADSQIPILAAVTNFSVRRTSVVYYPGAGASFLAINDAAACGGGTISALAATATSPVMGQVTTVSNTVEGCGGSPVQISGRTHGIIFQCLGSDTVITAIRVIACGGTNNSRANTIASDGAPSSYSTAFVGYSSTGGAPYASNTHFTLIVSTGAASTGVDLGFAPVAAASPGTVYKTTVYEDIANQLWWGCVSSSSTGTGTCVSTAMTNGPSTGTLLSSMSAAYAIGTVSGVWANAYIQAISDWF